MHGQAADESPLITLRRAAMNYLARREHSFHELILKLGEKYPEFDKNDEILPALTRLKNENLQSDQRFLESYVRYRRNKGFGPIKIEAELYQKGVDSNDVKTELYSEDNDWNDICQQAFQKRFRCIDTGSLAEIQRYQRFLIQRGFLTENIRAALEANKANL